MITGQELVEEYEKTFGKYSYAERDCITSIWKILEKYGAKASAIGSNWFARHEIINMRPLTSANQLYDGCAVLKTVKPGERNYHLPDRYKNDANQIDYNHIGIGTSAGKIYDSTRIKRGDGSYLRDGPGISTAPINSNSWDVIGDFEDVDYSTVSEQKQDEPAADNLAYQGSAIVVAEKGRTVNLRERPSISQNTTIREYVKVGTTVDLIERKDGWYKIHTPSGKNGWMKNEFLLIGKPAEDQSDEEDNPFSELEYIRNQLLKLAELLDSFIKTA